MAVVGRSVYFGVMFVLYGVKEVDGEVRSWQTAYLYRIAPRGPFSLTSPGDKRIIINSEIDVANRVGDLKVARASLYILYFCDGMCVYFV